MSDSNRTQIAYKAEATFGATVGTAAIAGGTLVRYNKSSLSHGNMIVLSDEIVSTGARSDQILVGYQAKGVVSSELSYGGFIDDWIEAWCGGTWTANVVKAGAPNSVNRSFLIEDGSLDINQFFRLNGMVIDTWTYNLEAAKIVMCDFGFMGLSGINVAPTSIFTTPTAVNTNPVMSASAQLTALMINGTASAAKITKMTFEGKRNLRERRFIGSLLSDDFGRGFIEMGGSLEVYFTDLILFNAFLANSQLGLSYVLGSGASKLYAVSLPKIKISELSKPIPGGNSDVLLTCKWTAFFDPVSGYVMQITRTP